MGNDEIIELYVSNRAWSNPKTAKAIHDWINETVTDSWVIAIVNWNDGEIKRGLSACQDNWWLLFDWEEDGAFSTSWLGLLSGVRVEESRTYLPRTVAESGEVYPPGWGPLEKFELAHAQFPGGRLRVELEAFRPDAREEMRGQLLRACGWRVYWEMGLVNPAPVVPRLSSWTGRGSFPANSVDPYITPRG